MGSHVRAQDSLSFAIISNRFFLCFCAFLSSILKRFGRPLFPDLRDNSPAVLPGRRQHLRGAKPGGVLLPQHAKTNRLFWILLADRSCLLMEPRGVREKEREFYLFQHSFFSSFKFTSNTATSINISSGRSQKVDQQGAFLELVENKSVFDLAK